MLVLDRSEPDFGVSLLYYEGKMMRTIFSQNYVYVLRATTTRHMVSFIDFYFHFLKNFQT